MYKRVNIFKIYRLLYVYTVVTESIQTPLNFSLCYIAAIC